MITRVSFNFANKCNLGCKFCYIPFDGRESEPTTWQRVVARVCDLGATQISFGGGDPFMYDDFPSLLTWVREVEQRISLLHVDTNGMALKPAQYPVLADTVHLLGLPLDGSNAALHALTRPSKASFGRVVRHLAALADQLPIKINTLVNERNNTDLPRIFEVIKPYTPAIWALYQFWPLGERAVGERRRFETTPEVYLKSVEFARLLEGVCVEIATIHDRAGTYFLVTQTGRAYAVTETATETYVELGSVFDDSVIDRWTQCVDPELNAHRMDHRIDVLKAVHSEHWLGSIGLRPTNFPSEQ